MEFRAFEMPPHARMSAAQMLLMRAAVAAFWQHPYERRLVRWGTRLHDDFMLPHYVRRRISATRWRNWPRSASRSTRPGSRRISEFRFPQIGDVTVRGVELELRHALEPWHVLGEEPAAGGTARYVDSSAERLQARVTGWVDGALRAGLQRRRACR